MAKVPLADQIAEVEREIASRISTYPQRILEGSLLQRDADERLPRMFAVLHTLQWLEANEELMRDMHSALKAFQARAQALKAKEAKGKDDGSSG